MYLPPLDNLLYISAYQSIEGAGYISCVFVFLFFFAFLGQVHFLQIDLKSQIRLYVFWEHAHFSIALYYIW